MSLPSACSSLCLRLPKKLIEKNKKQKRKTYNHLISFRSSRREECRHVAYEQPIAFSGCHMSKLNLGQLHVEVTVALLVIFSPASLPLYHCASFLHLSPAHLLLLFLILPSHLCGICSWSDVWEFPNPQFLRILRKLSWKFCLLWGLSGFGRGGVFLQCTLPPFPEVILEA